jgi:hypothetical protein
MRYVSFAAALAFTLAAGAVPAEAKGCIKGAIVGGAAGHLAHHGVLGAVGGCIVGHHMANEKAKEQPMNEGTAAQNPHPAPPQQN